MRWGSCENEESTAYSLWSYELSVGAWESGVKLGGHLWIGLDSRAGDSADLQSAGYLVGRNLGLRPRLCQLALLARKALRGGGGLFEAI